MTEIRNSMHKEADPIYSQICFGHWVLEFEYYPSTGLRVVILSNYLAQF